MGDGRECSNREPTLMRDQLPFHKTAQRGEASERESKWMESALLWQPGVCAATRPPLPLGISFLELWAWREMVSLNHVSETSR